MRQNEAKCQLTISVPNTGCSNVSAGSKEHHFDGILSCYVLLVHLKYNVLQESFPTFKRLSISEIICKFCAFGGLTGPSFHKKVMKNVPWKSNTDVCSTCTY